MKSHVRVAVIGGGVVGCSVLYHLTKHGWKDVALLERAELTSGSTWHAAGGMHTFNTDPNVAKLQDYTLKVYKEIEEASGQSCGIHLTGGLMLADTQDRLDYLNTARGRGRYLGLDTEFIDLQEAARMLPIMDPKHYVGVLYDPNEGHIDPSGVTHAYAGAARKGGAEIYRETRVVDLSQRADGTWDVITEKGTLHAEHVVNAAGLWAREVGLMAGVAHPFAPMEHQYIVTDEVPEIAESGTEMLHVIDFGGELYMRQEGKGVLVGTYEKHGKPWSEHTTPWDFGHELLPDDLDRIGDNLMRAFERFPALEKAGIKQIINGPFTFTPDGNPLVGPVPEVKNYWAACGVLAGFSQGGGVGLALAHWMIDGDPGMDTWAMDAARFGDYAGPAYSRAMARQTYATRFLVPFPNEERPAGRPLRRTPIYDRLEAKGAVFGAAFGLEQALWYAPAGTEPVETLTFRRSNAHGPVGAECRAVREGVGITETSGFAKYEITGPGAELWLGRLLANRIPAEGRMVLSPMLNPRGTLIGDFTLAKLGPERFMIFGSGPAEAFHMRWFRQHMPDDGVSLRSLRTELMGLSIAGPKARELLSRVTASDVSNKAFRFMAIRPMEIGLSPAPGRAHHLHRRSRLRNLDEARLSASHLRHPARGGRGSGAPPLRQPGAQLAAPGEGLRQLHPGVHARLHAAGGGSGALRGSAQERLHRARGGDGGEAHRPETQAGDLQGRCEGRGRTRQRAGAVRWRGGRLGDIRRLLPPFECEHRPRLRAGRACRAHERLPDRDPR